MTAKMAGMFAAGLVIGGGLIWITLVGNEVHAPTDGTENGVVSEENENGEGTMHESSDSLSVVDQEAGMRVSVTSLRLSEDAWVVVHELWPNGDLGNALGAAMVRVGANDASVELLRGTVPGGKYRVLLYADNDDGAFDLDTDTKLWGADGSLIHADFFALSSGIDGLTE